MLVFVIAVLELFFSVVFLELPVDPRIILSASLNGDLFLVLADGQTVLTAPMLYVIRLRIILPVLIALGTVARVENDIRTGVIQTGLISADFTRFAKQPELVTTLQMARP